MNIVAPEPSTLVLDVISFLFYELRAALVGGVGVGLLLGALYFLGFLVYISRLPKDDRRYKQEAHLLEAEKLLRYVILIFCIVTLNVLFCLYFDFGRKCTKVGVLIWLGVGAFHVAKHLRGKQLEKVKN